MNIDQPNELRKLGQVRMLMDLGHDRLKKLSDVVYSLEEYFRPVLRSPLPISGKDKKTEESTVSLVNEIQENNILINDLTEVLEDLIFRC